MKLTRTKAKYQIQFKCRMSPSYIHRPRMNTADDTNDLFMKYKVWKNWTVAVVPQTWIPYEIWGNINKLYKWEDVSRFNTLRPRQNGRHFADDVFKCIFMNGNLLISIKISLEFVPKGPINNIPALVQIMAWRRIGDKPLSEPMMA